MLRMWIGRNRQKGTGIVSEVYNRNERNRRRCHGDMGAGRAVPAGIAFAGRLVWHSEPYGPDL